jgi:probable biosynthetic protein (TIGR04098 family)
VFAFDLLLGLPHTNHQQLAEHLLLAHAGHLQWQSMAGLLGTPLSRLRTVSGAPVYATFHYIEERIPPEASLDGFGLDATLRFVLRLRAYKNMAVDGRVLFHRKEVVEAMGLEDEAAFRSAEQAGDFPYLRLANVFITPAGGNDNLKFAPPAGVSFEGFDSMPLADSAHVITRKARESGGFDLLGQGWSEDDVGPVETSYEIDPDRDTNGAGLVYFANYVAFLDAAERAALSRARGGAIPSGATLTRRLRARRLAYYGNVELDDGITTRVRVFGRASDPTLVGFHYRVERKSDGQLICLSEAIKALPIATSQDLATASGAR